MPGYSMVSLCSTHFIKMELKLLNTLTVESTVFAQSSADLRLLSKILILMA